MSKENAKKFLQFILKEGGEFSHEDMLTALKEMHGNSELTDKELEAISGGILKGTEGIIIKNDDIPMKCGGSTHRNGMIL